MWGDKVRRRQSTEALCCFTPPSPPLSSCARLYHCLFVYRVAWPHSEECSLVSFASASPSAICVAPSALLHPCVSPIFHLSPCLSAPLPMCLFLFGPPTQNSRFNSGGFSVNHTWNLPRFLNASSSANALLLDLLLGCRRDCALIIPPVIGFPKHRSCDLHEVTFSSNTQTFATFFSGKQLTVLLSLLPPSLSAVPSLFSPRATPLPPCLPLPLAIVFAQTDKIYCQKNEGVCEVWLAKLLVYFFIFFIFFCLCRQLLAC